MIHQLLLSTDCWLQHLALDPDTGLDPDGVKLRPASGLAAADYIVADFWVLAPLIQNLADVGYDERTMYAAAYDWRLDFADLEAR